MKTFQRILSVFFFSAVIVSGCLPDPQNRQTANAGEEPTPIPTAVAVSKPTYTVGRGDVVYEQVLSGRVVPAYDASLSFALSGVVAEVYVGRNDFVEAGDVIAVLETLPLQEALLAAQSGYDIAAARLESFEAVIAVDRRRAELNVQLAQLDLDFARSQAGSTPSSQAAYQIGRLEIQLELAQLALQELAADVDPSLQADLDAAALRVAEAEKALEQAALVAPIGGEILSLSLSPGKLINAFEPIGSIADVSELEVSALTSASVMAEMEEGMAVSISFASMPGEAFTGTIRRLPYPFGSGDRQAEDTAIRFSFDGPGAAEDFSVGDRVTVRIVIAERGNVLWLPPAAIREFTGREFVVVQDASGNQRRVDITIGIRGQDRVEILEGLQEGETIIGQ